MKAKVTYFNKCLKCGKITEYIARDKNVNANIRDADIMEILE